MGSERIVSPSTKKHRFALARGLMKGDPKHMSPWLLKYRTIAMGDTPTAQIIKGMDPEDRDRLRDLVEDYEANEPVSTMTITPGLVKPPPASAPPASQGSHPAKG